MPFDKGIRICVMKSDKHNSKMETITNLRQFPKLEEKGKDEKHPTVREE